MSEERCLYCPKCRSVTYDKRKRAGQKCAYPYPPDHVPCEGLLRSMSAQRAFEEATRG